MEEAENPHVERPKEGEQVFLQAASKPSSCAFAHCVSSFHSDANSGQKDLTRARRLDPKFHFVDEEES